MSGERDTSPLAALALTILLSQKMVIIVKTAIVAHWQTDYVTPPEIATSPSRGSVLLLRQLELPMRREGNFTREIPRCPKEVRLLGFEVSSSSEQANRADLVIG